MIIGLSAKMGSGKSTAVEALKTLGRPVFPNKFAGPLYQIQDFIYRMIAPVYTPPEGFKKDRKLLQWLGTDFGRALDEQLWVKLWKVKTEKVQATDADLIVVSDDVRYENEAEAVRAMGGVVIKIERGDAAWHAEGGQGIEGHSSEGGLSPRLIDYTIKNEGTREEFQKAFLELVSKIESGQAL